MLDIFEENDRRYLRHEMLGWYMPQNDSFALRQHLRPEHLRHNTPLPEITIQVCVWGGVVPEWQLRAAPAFEVRAPAAKHGPAGDHQTGVCGCVGVGGWVCCPRKAAFCTAPAFEARAPAAKHAPAGDHYIGSAARLAARWSAAAA
eukprot:scaffold239280_cov18-Tisochrysis_lutea.AAC.1